MPRTDEERIQWLQDNLPVTSAVGLAPSGLWRVFYKCEFAEQLIDLGTGTTLREAIDDAIENVSKAEATFRNFGNN